jgi:hypothetical protein
MPFVTVDIRRIGGEVKGAKVKVRQDLCCMKPLQVVVGVPTCLSNVSMLSATVCCTVGTLHAVRIVTASHLHMVEVNSSWRNSCCLEWLLC